MTLRAVFAGIRGNVGRLFKSFPKFLPEQEIGNQSTIFTSHEFLEAIHDNDIIHEPSYKLVINLGPLGKIVYIISKTQLELFILQYSSGGPITISNIDDEVIGVDGRDIVVWSAYNMGRIELPFLKELGIYDS